MATDFAKANQGYFAIGTDSPEYSAWIAYFDRLGWQPRAFRRLAWERDAEWTAPCQFPEWMPEFENWCATQPAPKETAEELEATPRAMRESLADLRKRHGQDWGLGRADAADANAKQRHLAEIQAANQRAWEKIGTITSGGIPISDALRRALEQQKQTANKD